MLFIIRTYGHPYNNKASIQPPLRDESRSLSKDHNLKRPFTCPNPLIDPTKQELVFLAASVANYSKKDFQ